jgi:hypothetical protein
MQSTYIMGSSFTKLKLFFHTVSITINTLFPSLHETQYAGRLELSAVPARRRRRQNGGLGVHASGGPKNMEVGWRLTFNPYPANVENRVSS